LRVSGSEGEEGGKDEEHMRCLRTDQRTSVSVLASADRGACEAEAIEMEMEMEAEEWARGPLTRGELMCLAYWTASGTPPN
jgi:hypothetical protein